MPHRANVMLDDADFFKNYYVLSERENGLPQMQVTDLATGKSRRIEFPEPAYSVTRMPTANTTPVNTAMATSRSLRRARCTNTIWPPASPRC